jgi:DNA-binding NtrC family response regulator
MRTETDRHPRESPDRRRGATRVLYIAFRAHDPLALPSRHVISDIDVIRFGRGDAGEPSNGNAADLSGSAGASITRDRAHGLRRLLVRVPDPRMSSEHGQLVRAMGRWVLDDPASKNGAVVDGVHTRSSVVGFGQLFSLGHTLFCLAREHLDGRAEADLAAAALSAPAPELATFDPTLAAEVERMARIAATDMPVLFLGEIGTGKEVMARALHVLSRRPGPFVAVNCGGLAPTLLETELFGHRRGAFSGAVGDRAGYVRSADRGTLFLDEIADLPLPAQAALLRVLQEREVVPVGDSVPVPVDIRVCAATHRDLAAMVATGQFREDLHARLQGLTVTLPPLRMRRADLGLLVPALLRRVASAERVRFTAAAASRLYTYRWPRNIRELVRALEFMTALARTGPIGVDHLPDEIRASGATSAAMPSASRLRAADPAPSGLAGRDLALKQELERLLHNHGHNLAEVARQLGKDRTQIYRWVQRLGIRRRGLT